MGPIQREIVERLTRELSPLRLHVRNDSEQHRGHAGHDGSGESHFSVEVVSAAFVGKNRVARQRAVNHALGDLMETIHALSIRALAPDEETMA